MKSSKAILTGCGGISDCWLPVLTNHSEIELVGLVDIDLEAARAKAAQHGLSREIATSDLALCIERTGAGVVFDCTIPAAHRSVVLTAVGAGCHVFGEKPLAENLADAKQMVEAARKTGVQYGVMQNRRWQPQGISRVRKALDDGLIGSPHTFHTDFFIGAHFGGFREEMEHVLLLDMAIHSFDQIRALTNSEPQSVWASDWNPEGSWFAHGASAVAFFTHERGVRSSYRGSWCAEGLSTSWQCAWRIIGTEGTLIWDGEEGIAVERVCGTEGFTRETKTIEVPKAEDQVPEGHEAAILDFIKCLKTGASPATPAADNIRSLAMVHGAIASAESNQTVSLEELLR